jgi:uncharacterized protein with ParB-like and HNH nuclease domain
MDNTTLITGKKYIKDIFSQEQFFNIPEYQRPYVWGEEQIVALLEDISKAMDNDMTKEYFLGCMIGIPDTISPIKILNTYIKIY